MTGEIVEAIEHRLRTPRSAAVAGIAFSVLLGTSYVLVRMSVPTWVLIVSIYILSGNLRTPALEPPGDAVTA